MKQQIQVNFELAESHGLTREEYTRIQSILGREPTFTELGIFSVMWSEHCSYKSSKPLLQKFPTSGKQILVGAGEENAGAVDIGDGLAVVFKMESHNHPSAVEPFQGAATGVGGIIRDIFTMGARPIALMDSLRFGPLTDPRTRYLLRGVVEGIAGYGNCMGIPTVGGETSFDTSYRGNPLVNVFCLGLVPKDRIVKACAEGVGNPIFYVGAATGRDGLGGASFASRELTDTSHQDRPSVQIGDPFMEKLLLEATLELIDTGIVVGMQDMGAAGLTSSTVETAERGEGGIVIDIARVPRREEGMHPYEVMLSESQERMLVIVRKGEEDRAREIFQKWDLHAVNIGQVIADNIFLVQDNGTTVARIPVDALTSDAPVYHREMREPRYLKQAQELDLTLVPVQQDYSQVTVELLSSVNLNRKSWVYEQYDHMVGTNTVLLPGADGAVIRLKHTDKALAMSCDGNGRYCYLDPYEGGKSAVAESARNVVCVGAQPTAITNCLNFGTPTDPEIFWQFTRCVEGIIEACRVLGTPVTGGNVSFYNENPDGAIDPTPVIGMLGIIENINMLCTPEFKQEGDIVAIIGNGTETLGGSEYLHHVHGLKRGLPPRVDLPEERRLQQACLHIIRQGLAQSVHDIGTGGLAIALAECCILHGIETIGALITLEDNGQMRDDEVLFGESSSRIVLSCKPDDLPQIQALAESHGVALAVIGTVVANNLSLTRNNKKLVSLPSKHLYHSWKDGLEKLLTG